MDARSREAAVLMLHVGQLYAQRRQAENDVMALGQLAADEYGHADGYTTACAMPRIHELRVLWRYAKRSYQTVLDVRALEEPDGQLLRVCALGGYNLATRYARHFLAGYCDALCDIAPVVTEFSPRDGITTSLVHLAHKDRQLYAERVRGTKQSWAIRNGFTWRVGLLGTGGTLCKDSELAACFDALLRQIPRRTGWRYRGIFV